jgi:hypothetical protein
MTRARIMLSRAEDYLAERRHLVFDLHILGQQIIAFARFVDGSGHKGPLTKGILLEWVQGKARHATASAWARRLAVLRPFARYLARFDAATEFPGTAIFGRSHRRVAPHNRRVAPHIYTGGEIADLLAAARRLPGGNALPRRPTKRSSDWLQRPVCAFRRRCISSAAMSMLIRHF